MALESVDEGSAAELTVTFKDKDGQPEAPASLTYRVDCLTNNQQVRGDTALSPAATVTIQLTPSDNAIIDQNNAKEKRLVTVKANFGADDADNREYTYEVKNLIKVT